jgi:L-threonylcarbamoyladenylate synthase
MGKSRIEDASDPMAIEQAAAILRSGGLVAFPTETVYGLGADACNALAVARIFEVKKRPYIDPIIVHVADPDSVPYYGECPEIARRLMQRFWPGPLTLVVPKTGRIPPIVTAGLDSVAIRMPAHRSALELIRAAGGALAAPSANVFGYVSPTEAAHVAEQFGDRIDLILDGGRCTVGVESTVLALTGPVPRILRAGGVSPEELSEVISCFEWANGDRLQPESPGQLSRHYATRTRLEILAPDDPRAKPATGERVGLIALTPPPESENYLVVEVLSKTGNLREAAANLFGALYRLDGERLDRLIAYPVPETGLGIAIMDRLRRCSSR